MNCSNLDAVIDILGAKLIPDMLELSRPRKYTGDKVCKLKPDLTVQVKTKCQFGNWCTLSVKSILNRSCPNDGDNLTVLYKCVKNSDEINPGQFQVFIIENRTFKIIFVKLIRDLFSCR